MVEPLKTKRWVGLKTYEIQSEKIIIVPFLKIGKTVVVDGISKHITIRHTFFGLKIHRTIQIPFSEIMQVTGEFQREVQITHRGFGFGVSTRLVYSVEVSTDFGETIEIADIHQGTFVRSNADFAEGVENAIKKMIGLYQYTSAQDIEAQKINRELAESHNTQGVIHAENDQFELAISELNKAIDIDPSFASAYFNRAMVFEDIGRLDEALCDYKQFISCSRGPRGVKHARKAIKNISQLLGNKTEAT